MKVSVSGVIMFLLMGNFNAIAETFDCFIEKKATKSEMKDLGLAAEYRIRETMAVIIDNRELLSGCPLTLAERFNIRDAGTIFQLAMYTKNHCVYSSAVNTAKFSIITKKCLRE